MPPPTPRLQQRAKRVVEALVVAVKRLEEASNARAGNSGAAAAAAAPLSKDAAWGSAAALGRTLADLVATTSLHPRFDELYTVPLERFPLGCFSEPELEDVLFGVDCEMIACVEDDMALARVSIVRASMPLTTESVFETVLDMHVMPVSNPSFILDTREEVTGITKQVLLSSGIPLDTALRQVHAIFTELQGRANVILVGHALEHDLLALKLRFERVIDTALLFVVEDVDPAVQRKTHSLGSLAEAVLGDDALKGRFTRGGKHDSVEDATLALRLAAVLLESFGSASLPIALPKTSARAAKRALTDRGVQGLVRANQAEMSRQMMLMKAADQRG